LANPEHLAKLKEGVDAWNHWREQSPEIKPYLGDANLRGANLHGANLFVANLEEADLSTADLTWAHLTGADLTGANLAGADLAGADLVGANLSGANLSGADLGASGLIGANLSGANLSAANLSAATLVGTNLEGANLTACRVFGISAWNVRLEGAIQSNLVITPRDESPIQVDNLEVAQFIYLLLNNEKIRSVIDTITSKVVLILGRFTPERKVVLDAIRDELRKRDYLPVLFDFEKPASKDLTGTISTLANMARFVIADLTDPSSVPHELATLVPNTVVPVQTIILEGQREYAMFPDLVRRYRWVLEPLQYKSQELLVAHLGERVIAPAEAKAKELARKTDARY
jgi:Pentapeptide repeats (8 copies)